MIPPMIETASDLIDALGGNKSVGEIFGVGTSAVSNWRAMNRFPPRLHYRLHTESKRRRLSVSPKLFTDRPREAAQ